MAEGMRFIDIGANLTSRVFHIKDDFDLILERARNTGVWGIIVTGSNLAESRAACELAYERSKKTSELPHLFATVGVHPLSIDDIEKDHGLKQKDKTPAQRGEAYLEELRSLIKEYKDKGICVAVGEIGLDKNAERAHYYKDFSTQTNYFRKQLELAVEFDLPLFLHSRESAEEFKDIVSPFLDRLPKKGVVHSFTGSADEMKELLELGFDIGFNGCSLKTEENIAVLKACPVGRLHLETDAPWCTVGNSSAAMTYVEASSPEFIPKYKEANKSGKKFAKGKMSRGRNEPRNIDIVAYTVASVQEPRDDFGGVMEIAEIAFNNSERMFNLIEAQRAQQKLLATHDSSKHVLEGTT